MTTFDTTIKLQNFLNSDAALRFFEGDNKTANMLNERLKDDDISKVIHSIIGDEEAEPTRMLFAFDKKQFLDDVDSNIEKITALVKNSAIAYCIGNYFTKFIEAACKTEVNFNDEIENIDVEKAINAALISYISQVYVPEQLNRISYGGLSNSECEFINLLNSISNIFHYSDDNCDDEPVDSDDTRDEECDCNDDLMDSANACNEEHDCDYAPVDSDVYGEECNCDNSAIESNDDSCDSDNDGECDCNCCGNCCSSSGRSANCSFGDNT